MARPNVPWYRSAKDGWYVKIGGRTLSLGVKGKENEQAALVAFGKLLAGQQSAKLKPVGGTLRSLFDTFLTANGHLKPKTVARYRYDVGVFLSDCGSLRPSSLTHRHIRNWLNSLKGSSTTKAIMLRSVSAFLGWCVREEAIPENPAKKVPKPKTKSRSDSILISDADHKKLLEAATKEFRLVLRVLHATGCRPGEIIRLTAESFNSDARCFVVWEHKTDRTGKPRLVSVTTDLVEEFRKLALKHPTGPLLRSRKGVPWKARSILDAMRRLRKKTGVKAIAYGYRHTFVTDGLKSGVSGPQVAALVGHTSTAVIDKFYSHLGAAGKELLEALKFREQKKTPA